jgi:hypothetical protein
MQRNWNTVWLVLTLTLSSVGLTSCAKYPVVTDLRAPSPSAEAPTRTR